MVIAEFTHQFISTQNTFAEMHKITKTLYLFYLFF